MVAAINIVCDGAGAFVEMPVCDSIVFPAVDHPIGTVEVTIGDFLVLVQLQDRHPAVIEEVACPAAIGDLHPLT